MKRQGFIQPHFSFFKAHSIVAKNTIFFAIKKRTHQKSGAGFTLIELLISIAITGILAAMMFNNFSQEKNRNALKGTVHQLQTDIQAMQTNAQGGVISGVAVPPGYGNYIPLNGVSYTSFADLNGNGQHDATDTDIRTTTIPITLGVVVSKLSNGAAINYDSLHIVFGTPNGSAKITGKVFGTGALDFPNVATIYIKSTKLNVCYAITVTAVVGTVSQRQFTDVSTCG